MISIRNLNKKYKTVPVLKDINLSIEASQIVALLGPNGSGKSTLLKGILKLVPLESGSHISIQDINILEKSYKIKDIGYMPQNPEFPSNLKVFEIIEIFEFLENESPQYKDILIKDLLINLFIDKKFEELSGGMKQRLNILQCFMFDKKLLILDEPTASLDPQISHYLKTLILDRKKKNVTIIFTTHVLSEVENFADKFILLQDGTIKLYESPQTFINKMQASSLEESIYRHYNEFK